MNAINVLIGKKKYIFSDTEPSLVDFSIFGVCSQIKYNDTGVLNIYLNSNLKNLNKYILIFYWLIIILKQNVII